MYKEIVDLIVATAHDLGEDEIGVSTEFSEETVLFGKDGVLDSMGLVTLIVAVEQALEDRYERTAGLADEKAMSQARSPYRSVASLAEYAVKELEQGD